MDNLLKQYVKKAEVGRTLADTLSTAWNEACGNKALPLVLCKGKQMKMVCYSERGAVPVCSGNRWDSPLEEVSILDDVRFLDKGTQAKYERVRWMILCPLTSWLFNTREVSFLSWTFAFNVGLHSACLFHS